MLKILIDNSMTLTTVFAVISVALLLLMVINRQREKKQTSSATSGTADIARHRLNVVLEDDRANKQTDGTDKLKYGVYESVYASLGEYSLDETAPGDTTNDNDCSIDGDMFGDKSIESVAMNDEFLEKENVEDIISEKHNRSVVENISVRYKNESVPSLEVADDGWVYLPNYMIKVNGREYSWSSPEFRLEKGDSVVIDTGVMLDLPEECSLLLAQSGSIETEFGVTMTPAITYISKEEALNGISFELLPLFDTTIISSTKFAKFRVQKFYEEVI